jgi:two-component system sensor histidine kinase KdpD
MMLRSLSHDLRTPLATIMGASSMLADDSVPLTDAQRRQQADNIYQQSKLLNQHFEKVLELSKAQLPQSSLKWQQFAADELMAGALARRGDELQPLFSQVLRQTTAELCGDLTLLEIALANMLENAVRHGTAPFLVNFQHDQAGNFQMRVDNQIKAVKDKGRDAGNGLGVNICQTIAGLHGGQFQLSIGSEGCHAIFSWRQNNVG